MQARRQIVMVWGRLGAKAFSRSDSRLELAWQGTRGEIGVQPNPIGRCVDVPFVRVQKATEYPGRIGRRVLVGSRMGQNELD